MEATELVHSFQVIGLLCEANALIQSSWSNWINSSHWGHRTNWIDSNCQVGVIECIGYGKSNELTWLVAVVEVSGSV